jgi:hypothetical protein
MVVKLTLIVARPSGCTGKRCTGTEIETESGWGLASLNPWAAKSPIRYTTAEHPAICSTGVTLTFSAALGQSLVNTASYTASYTAGPLQIAIQLAIQPTVQLAIQVES